MPPRQRGCAGSGRLARCPCRKCSGESVTAKIDELAGPAEPPARLHGDLWSGNVHAGAGHTERVALHQLLPLLVHAVLFGGGYGASARRAAERFV